MDSLEEMDEFLEMQNLPRLNQEEIENMNRSTASKKIKLVILKTPNKLILQIHVLATTF